jgi:uncharacterized membrane protein
MGEALSAFCSARCYVLMTAALPIVELRGAIPLGISMGLSPFQSMLWGFIGSMIPAPLILLATRPIFSYLKGTKPFRNLIKKITDKSISDGTKIERYGALGLLVFVAIPLPGTGVWSGSLAAALLDMSLRRALPLIFLGNSIAAFLLYLLSIGALSVFG